ncbi:MAG: anaerobic ribonucleoside-triphosphate reductase activating protein [Campylobacterales bacterium]|nr:anaerobic ribonucleoside-triphosphate reductase activating protein [Campylobacterales bacterium]
MIYDITKFTTLDYKNHLSCIIWFIKCNMRCKYCYNNDLVFSSVGKYCFEEIIEFLKTRVGLLDAVVLSGGEASIHNLPLFCKKIKDLGFKIKLDTNGLNTNLIKELIKENLLDYIALDFKSPKNKFKSITSSSSYEDFIETLKYLIKIDFSFEVRTTVQADLLNENDINEMINILFDLKYKNTYYLQNFLETSSNIGKLKESKILFNKNLLSNKINLEWRN